jgi:hypothetical protein
MVRINNGYYFNVGSDKWNKNFPYQNEGKYYEIFLYRKDKIMENSEKRVFFKYFSFIFS